MEDDPDVSKMSIENDKNVTIDNFNGENGGNSELMSSSSVPDDFTLGNHGSQDALDMPPCGTNSSNFDGENDKNVTIDNFDGENGGNSELMSSSRVPDDLTLGNHGSQDALNIPPCGTNSSSASANINMNVTIDNFDGENGGNGVSNLSSGSGGVQVLKRQY